ncbi:MAG: hypothetical protein JST73_12860 [Actinobacteria bacterium]|nr:hypothetical protein [Actinomycetota bacterium]
MISFDTATVFAAWATGCLAWQAVIGARREVVFGAAWVIRVGALMLAGAALVAAFFDGWSPGRDVAIGVLVVVTGVALATSITEHRRAKVSGEFDAGRPDAATRSADRLDGFAAAAGAVAVILGALDAGGPAVLAVARYVVGAAALGGLTFTLVFGHRMLAKPYLGRGPLELATTALLIVWPFEIGVMLIPTGMVSVLDGMIDDGYAGILGWMWAMCALTTGVLVIIARVILADREHSKAASATGMLYLSGLCGIGAVLISRAVLSG